MGCSHGLQWAVCIQCAWQLAFIVLVISPSDRSVNNNTRRKFQLGRANFQLAWKCFTCRAASLCRCVLTVRHHIASHRGEMSKMCEMHHPNLPCEAKPPVVNSRMNSEVKTRSHSCYINVLCKVKRFTSLSAHACCLTLQLHLPSQHRGLWLHGFTADKGGG